MSQSVPRTGATSASAATAAAHTHVGLFTADADGVVTWANAAAAQLISPGARWHLDLALDPPAAGPAVGSTVRHRTSHVDPNGQEHVHALSLSPAADGTGSVIGTIVEGSDASVRQQTTLLATVVASTSDVVAIMSTEGDLRFLNRAGREALGVQGRGPVRQLHATSLFGVEGWMTLRATAVPYATTRGTWSGDAQLHREDGSALPVSLVLVAHRDPLGRVDRFSVVARDASDQKAVEQRLAREAITDALTGLPNRAHLQEVLREGLARSAEHGRPVGVLFCDLDRFKQVNDSLGHLAGDRLLHVVAGRIRRRLRDGDVAARFGGDEFLVVAHDVEDPAAVLNLAERVRAALDDPVRLEEAGGRQVRLSFSIGVALSGPEDTVKGLIARADDAMYRAKARGKNRVEMLGPDEQHRPAAAVAHDALRAAIEGHQLRLHYQPIMDLTSRRVVGAEALVRWRHPQRGLIPPSAFLDVAEQTGLMRPLGSWVLAEAIEQAAAWAADTALPPGLRLHLNLSTSQLLEGDVAERATAILAAFGLPAHALCVEVDERTFDSDELARTQLAAFRERGVRVAIDGFGSGITSIQQLRRHPVDVLKLDPELVAGLAGGDTALGAIAATVRTMADALAVEVVAEGIERNEQVAALRGLGIALGQGFLFAEGLAGDSFADHVRARAGEAAAAGAPSSSPAGRSAGPGTADADVDLGGDLAEDALPRVDHAAP